MYKKILVVLLMVTLSTAMVFAGGQGEAKIETTPTLRIWAVSAAEVPVDTKTVPIWTEVGNRLNLSLEWQMINAAVKDEQFNLMMVAKTMPDVVAYYEGQGGHTSLNRFGSEGAFVSLENLIREHAPNLKSQILDNPTIRESITAPDGNIYFVPMLSAVNAARGWFIRYDWLEKLNLPVPTTTEEFYSTLVAFRDNDPNGTGRNDTIPLVMRRRGDDAYYNLGALSYGFNAEMGWVLRNGRVVYGPTEPQFDEFVSFMNRLYSERLLDQEHFTRQGNARDELIGKNVTGAIHDWFASTADLNSTVGRNIPGFNLRHMPPPVASPNIKPYTRIQQSLVRADGGWAISANAKDPVAAIKFMDFVYSPEGRRLTNFGIEGVHYTMENGVPKYTSFITDNPDGLGFHEALVTIGAQWKVGMVQDADYEAQFANEIAFDARKDYMDNYIVEEFPVLGFTAREQEVLTDKLTQIETRVRELTSLAVVGNISIEEFRRQINRLDQLGLTDVIKIYQDAYNRK